MLTILGATGYTGRLCAAEAIRVGLVPRLAGRRGDALEALAAELGGRAEIAVADVADEAALRRLARSSTVLLTTVGPYVRLGQPVLDAALAGPCHYVDVSGEVGFLSWAYEQDARARAAGVALCPGFGFDGVPGDLLAALAMRELRAPVERARAAYLLRHAVASAGTARSALGVFASGSVAWRDGALVTEPVAAATWRVPFPPPAGVQRAVSVPLPEAVTLPRSTGARLARAYAVAPATLPAALLRAGAQAARVLARTPAWDLLERGVARLPQGPRPAQRERSSAFVVAQVTAGQRSCSASCSLTDVYGTTARIAVAVARRLLAGAGRPGAHTPSQMLDGSGRDLLLEVGATLWVGDALARPGS